MSKIEHQTSMNPPIRRLNEIAAGKIQEALRELQRGPRGAKRRRDEPRSP
jgi:hypothetical protein